MWVATIPRLGYRVENMQKTFTFQTHIVATFELKRKLTPNDKVKT